MHTLTARLSSTARDLVRRANGKTYPKELNVWKPNQVTVEFIRSTQCRSIAEIGIYEGHTSVEFARFLNGQGELHLYDFHDRVETVARQIRAEGYSNVTTFGSSHKLLDSYAWTLGKTLEISDGPIYDYIFLDGAHNWAFDGFATLLADRLLKVGGYLDFDDYEWSLARSKTLNPSKFPLTSKLYPQEQIEAQQVKMIVDVLIKRDSRYEEVIPNKIYRKVRP